MPPEGQIVGTQTLVGNGPPSSRFDIVILGEGYQATELDRFDAAAGLLARGLLTMPPFDSVRDLINVHAVRTVSRDSGVSRFPTADVKKQTFYGVEGFHQTDEITSPPAAFMGTPTPLKVLAAAEKVAPLEQLQLFIVLLNLTENAFSADPPRRMIFASAMHKDNPAETPQQKKRREALFVHTTAHEIAHAMTGNAEEYQDCGPAPIGRSYPNQMTEADRLAGRLKWKHLAKPEELNADGSFKAVNLFEDADVTFDKGQSPSSPSRPLLQTMLGLFWQCQDTDGSAGPCLSYHDPRGKHFYRPMAACKMRMVFSDFCRVCASEILRAIRSNQR